MHFLKLIKDKIDTTNGWGTKLTKLNYSSNLNSKGQTI